MGKFCKTDKGCKERAGDSSCHATRFCYSAGVTVTNCYSGLCFCKFGYSFNECTGKCEMREEYFMANSTAESLALRDMAAQDSMMNVLICSVWGAAIGVAILAVVGLAYRKVHVREETSYALLQ